MRNKVTLLLIVLLTANTFACRTLKHYEPQYGKIFNAKRKEIGLPIIPNNWEISSVHAEECTWVNPERKKQYTNRTPVHWSKYLNYRTGALISETDTYYGHEDYHLKDEGTYREELVITYFYQEDTLVYGSEAKTWKIWLYGNTAPEGKVINLQEAESILKEWGLDRLSYEFSSSN